MAAGGAAVQGTFGTQAPADGSFQAVLSAPLNGGTITQANLESFLGLTSGALNSLNSNTRHGGAAFEQTFTISVPSVVTFQWDFLPNGNTSGQNDYGFYTIHDSSSSSSSFTTLSSTTASGGSATGYQTASTGVLAPGSYLLGFAIYDNSGNFGPDFQDPNLLVDNVQVGVPEPATISLLLAALATLLVFRRLRPA